MVAKEGSIKEASSKLHVSQPTISDQIKLLEEFFNCELFERKNRSLSLTEQGRLVLEYADKIFDLSQEVTSRVRNKIQLPKKSVDIGITHFMTHYFLYDLILPLFDQSLINVNIKQNERHLLLADLEEELIDLVFSDSKEGISPSMTAFRVGVNKTFAIAHKKHKFPAKNFPQGLGKIPFFSYTKDSSLRYEIELYFAQHDVSPRVIGEADDIDLLQVVTEKAYAFTIVPEASMKKICQNKDVIVLGEIKELQTNVWGIIKKSYQGLGFDLLKKITK